MNMQLVLLFACIVLSSGEKRALKTVGTYSLTSFLKVFRASLLDHIAVQWNATILLTKELQQRMSACIPQIQTEVSKCENCTRKVCKQQPHLNNFLHQSNPTDALKQPLTDVGASLDDVVRLLGTKSFTFLDAMKGIATEGVNNIGDGLESAVDGLGHGLNNLGKLTIDGLGDLGNFAVDGLTNIGEAIGDGFKTAGETIAHGISDIFGRRKRYLDSVEKECMNRCDNDCWKLMTNNNTKMISYVCGSEVAVLNGTIHNNIERITALYSAALNSTSPIISKVEIDTSTVNSNMEAHVVYITTNIKGHLVRYRSSVPYKMMDVPETAKQMAQEMWSRWY